MTHQYYQKGFLANEMLTQKHRSAKTFITAFIIAKQMDNVSAH